MKRALVLALMLAAPGVFAATTFSQQQAAGQLVTQLRNAGNDALAMTRAVDAIAANPAAIDAVMASGDKALIGTYLKQAGLANARSVAAHQGAVADAEALIANFTKAAKTGNAAAESEAVLRLIENPQAVRRFNLFGDPKLVQRASEHMATIQANTQNLLRERIAQHLNIPPEELRFANITHASGKPKLGQDWDVTVRRLQKVVNPKTGKVEILLEDIRPAQIQEVVERSFFEAATGRAPASAAEARAFAEAKNVELTWALHKEAMGGSIGEGSRIIAGELAVRDAQQMALVSEFKAQKPIVDHADEVMRAAEAEIRALNLPAEHPEVQRILTKAEQAVHQAHVERARTYLKMFDKHIAPRVTGYGGKVPGAITEANKVMQALADDAISVNEAARRLGELGTNVDDVIYKSSGLVDAAKVLGRAKEPVPGFFAQQWRNVRNSKVLGPLFKNLGRSLGGAYLGGEFSKHLGEEMDRAIAVTDDADVTYALARTWDTGIAEPVRMLGELAGEGIGKGAIAIGQGMEATAGFLSGRAAEVGWVQAFGEGTALAIGKTFQGAGWALGTGAAKVYGGVEYLVSNPSQAAADIGAGLHGASLTAGEFLGVKAMSDLLVRDNATLMNNTLAMRGQLLDTANHLGDRADKLHALIARFKKAVREQDPESESFRSDVAAAFRRYEQEYGELIADYVRWRIFLNRNYGGIENPTIADAWRLIRDRVESITRLPPNLEAVLDQAFIDGLKSTVRLHLFDAATGEPITRGGYVQFSGDATLTCRGDGPVMGCANVPPGRLTLRIKVGDYAEVSREIVINPLARRSYDQRVNLNADAPAWARITVTVRDVDSGVAIPGASIRFDSNAEKTRETTTTTGAVQVNQVLAGEVRITASAAGYLSNRSQMRIDPAQDTEYALEIQLQPDGSAKAKPKAVAAPASFDCSQLRLTHNVNFSTWSCCQDDVEREMADSMCRAKRGEMNGKTVPFKSKIADAIRAAEGERFDRNADYTDYQTPYGSLREVQTCVDTQVDDFCRRLGAGAPTRKDEAEDKAAARKKAVEACYASKKKLIDNALKANSDGDSGFVSIYATEACKTASDQCEQRAYQAGQACRAKAATMDEVRACNEPQRAMSEKCAYQEVECSAAFYMQQCEEQVK